MTERYWITGAQIGTINALISNGKLTKAIELLEEVIDKQFIGNIQEPYNEYEIIIIKKGRKISHKRRSNFGVQKNQKKS